MITYEYLCEYCEYNFERCQSIKDKPLKKCPQCKKHKLERVIHGGIAAFVDKEPTTLGQLGRRNAYRDRFQLAEKQAIVDEITRNENEKTLPWYQQGAKKTPKEIQKMTNDQKRKYVMEGE